MRVPVSKVGPDPPLVGKHVVGPTEGEHPALVQHQDLVLLLGGEPGLGWPNFTSLGVTSDASFGTGAIYRGRFTSLTIVALADPDAPDDLFTARALCGEAGQRLQAFLTAAGLTGSYLILRTVPVDISDLTAAQRTTLVDHPAVRALHTEILHRLTTSNTGLAALLAIGPGAQRLAAHSTPTELPVLNMPAWSTSARAAWQNTLETLQAMTYLKDLAAQRSNYQPGAVASRPAAGMSLRSAWFRRSPVGGHLVTRDVCARAPPGDARRADRGGGDLCVHRGR